MYNNGYMNYGYSPYGSANTYGYNSTPYYQPYSQQGQQTVQPQQPMQYQEVPFSEVRYGTIDEAKAYIVGPSKSVMFINRDTSEFYIKSADNMGKPSLETFKYSKSTSNSTQPVSGEIDHTEPARERDMKDFVKRNELEPFLTAENAKDFVKKSDIKALTDKIEVLQKQISIANMVKREVIDDGK